MEILSEVKGELLIELGISSWDSNQFIDNLIQSNNLFKILDLKQDKHQKIVSSIVRENLKIGKIKLVNALFKQLQSYLNKHCSKYPLDFYAEIQQFQRNYPYREYKFNSLMRRINHRKDQFPIFLAQFDNSVVDDDLELELEKVWTEMKNSEQIIKVKQ